MEVQVGTTKNQRIAMKDWMEEMEKRGEYLPEMWPTEEIMNWGKRMEKEMDKYKLTEEEWLEIEAKKTELCLIHGRKMSAKGG